MKRYTRIFALLLSAVMLTACAADAEVQSPADTSVTTTSATNEPEDTTTATTSATTEPEDTTTVATSATTEPEETTTTATSATTEPVETATTEVTTEPVITTAETTATTSPVEEELPVETKYAALTFDDGPNTTTTAEVLDKLEKYGIVASFFLIGNNIDEGSAQVVKRAYDMGCEINNHSKTHPNMTEMTVDEIIAEFRYTDDKIYEITGERSKFFRPPYIAVNEDMLSNIDVPFIAGLGCNDWVDTNPADRRAGLILRQVKDGDIILLHDAKGNSQTVEALDTIIPEMLAQGYKFVTVTELFEIKGIPIDPDDNKIYTNVLQKYMYN